jgi:hypothetical protein
MDNPSVGHGGALVEAAGRQIRGGLAGHVHPQAAANRHQASGTILLLVHEGHNPPPAIDLEIKTHLIPRHLRRRSDLLQHHPDVLLPQEGADWPARREPFPHTMSVSWTKLPEIWNRCQSGGIAENNTLPSGPGISGIPPKVPSPSERETIARPGNNSTFSGTS